MDGFVEEVVKEEVFKVGVVVIGGGDVFEEDGVDNIVIMLYEGNGGFVEFLVVFFGCFLYEYEVLCVGDDFGGIEGLFEVFEELFFVIFEGGGMVNKFEFGGSFDMFFFDVR